MAGWDACKGERPAELLTLDEHEALRLSGQLSTLIRRICGTGQVADEDFNELAAPIHVIQRTVAAQAAARAYPYRYRLLGQKVLERDPVLNDSTANGRNYDVVDGLGRSVGQPLPSVGP